MAEQMIRKTPDNKMDKPSAVEDSGEKVKKGERGNVKSSTRRSQSKPQEIRETSPAVSVSANHEVQVAAEVHPSPKPSTSSATVTDYSQIFNMLKSIQHNQNKQSQEMKSLSSRMTEYENSYCTDEGYDYNNYDEYDEQNQETHDNDNQPDQDNNEGQNSNVDKRKSDENNNSKFAAMSKRFKTREICGDKIDDTLAENVTDLFRNGMNEDQFLELTKDENNPRPENCEGLVQVRTNQLIWYILSPSDPDI